MNNTNNTLDFNATNMDKFKQLIEDIEHEACAFCQTHTRIGEDLDKLLELYNDMEKKFAGAQHNYTVLDATHKFTLQDRDTNYIPISEHNKIMDECVPNPAKFVPIETYNKLIEDRNKVTERRDRWKERFWTASGDLHVAQTELNKLKERNKAVTHELLSKDNEVMLLGEEISQLNQKNVFLQNELDKVKKEKDQLKKENDALNLNGDEFGVSYAYPCIASFTDMIEWVSEADNLLGGLDMQVEKKLLDDGRVQRYTVTGQHLRNSIRHWNNQLRSYRRANIENQKIIEDLKKQLKEMSEANKKTLTLEQELDLTAKMEVGMDIDGDAVTYPHELNLVEVSTALKMIKKIGLKRVYLQDPKKPLWYIGITIDKIEDYIGELINANGAKAIMLDHHREAFSRVVKEKSEKEKELEELRATLAKANCTIAHFSTDNDELRLAILKRQKEFEDLESSHYESCKNYEKTIDDLIKKLNIATRKYNDGVRVPKSQQLMELYAMLERDSDGYVGFKHYISNTIKRTKDTKTETQILADLRHELDFVFRIVTSEEKVLEAEKRKEEK